MRYLKRYGEFVVLLVAAIALIGFPYWAFIHFPQWLYDAGSRRQPPGSDFDEKARSIFIQLVTGIAQVLGILGGALLLYYTWRTLHVDQESRVTERFTRAIEHLGATDNTGARRLEIRLGGIYGLERIARDSEDDYWPVMEVLTAYIREHAPWLDPRVAAGFAGAMPPPPQGGDAAGGIAPSGPPPMASGRVVLPSDIRAIVAVLKRRRRFYWSGEEGEEFLDLSRSDLRGGNFGQIHLEAADLRTLRN
jgi:hypothetical protein